MILILEIEGLEVYLMLKRTITAIVLVAILLATFLMGPSYVHWLLRLVMLLAGYEVYKIKKNEWPLYILFYILLFLGVANFDLHLLSLLSSLVIIGLFIAIFSKKVNFEDISFLIMMMTILILGVYSIKSVLEYPLWVFLYIIIGTYTTDTFAYLGGSLFGKHKLIESISPNKTIEGAMIGTVMSMIVSLLFAKYYVVLDSKVILITSLLMPFVAQIGDLTFSMIKRHYEIKDFSNLLPGHGGILDRIDSILFTILLFNTILMLFM